MAKRAGRIIVRAHACLWALSLDNLQVEIDLAPTGLPREKVLAAVVRLMECTFVRVGNPEYARQNESFGLTTLKSRHVRIRDDRSSSIFAQRAASVIAA
jgi:DNA topoisomerase IB